MEGKSIPSQALIKILVKKPGLKDTNFQVLKVKLEIVKVLLRTQIDWLENFSIETYYST